MLIQQIPKKIDESFSTINQLLIRRQPKRPRKRPIQQKNICEVECWAALLVVGILVLFCLTCIIHDFVVRKRKRKLDVLKKVAELESVKIKKAFSEKQSNNGSTNLDDEQTSRDQQMRNIRTGVKQLKESYRIEYRWPKKKRKIMKGLALRNGNGHLESIAEEEEESTEKCDENTEGEKSDTLVDDESVKNISEDGSEDLSGEESKIPEERTLHEINKGKQKEITD
ncbi:33798_t:CDS:2 [Gigaspora margarita]|uniref:33798_t:CDS:1 n=1 Tax=Gigaspora margarita TaxID=4874 RepID=A0ABN7V2X3_GIGMA|nr:33798_t:CDS:2 [Gigaspora margarita]